MDEDQGTRANISSQQAHSVEDRRWSRWLLTSQIDSGLLAASVLILISLTNFMLDRPAGLPAWRFYGTILTFVLLLLFLPLFFSRPPSFLSPQAAQWISVLGTAGFIFLISWLGQITDVFLVYLIVAVAFNLPRLGHTLLFSLGVTGGWLFRAWTLGLSLEGLFDYSRALLVGIVFVMTFMLLIRRLQTVNDELITARQREKELAVAEERVRLAREIHDGLGHHLTALNIQLQAAAKLITRDPDQAAEAIAACRSEAQTAIQEVRRSVVVMRRTPLDGLTLEQALVTLAHDFDQLSPLQVHFEQHGTAYPLPPAAALTLYRAAQEGLTNVQKHAAQAQQVQVRLDFTPQTVKLLILDDGIAEATANNGRGFGLTGLRERAEQLGGTLQAGPGPEGGFSLGLTLPAQEASP